MVHNSVEIAEINSNLFSQKKKRMRETDAFTVRCFHEIFLQLRVKFRNFYLHTYVCEVSVTRFVKLRM